MVAWIGHNDLLSMAFDLPGTQQKKVVTLINRGLPEARQKGPIRTLAERDSFGEIHLLSTYPDWVNGAYASWLGQEVRFHNVKIAKPTDYPSIFSAANGVLAQVTGGRKLSRESLCLHLSPGTPAMAAIWVLLGKSRYPATFYQSYAGTAWETDIPFDLVVDFVPELLRAPDRSLQNLASQSPQEVEGFEDIIGQSQAIRLAVGRAQKAAVRDVPVLILGETGTGKEMFARAIHAASHRKEGPFLPINCAAMPKDLLESQLFGHAKGAFTGADKAREGAFEAANGGTLFLDEVGECGPEMQAKLLRALQPPPGEGPCHRVFQRLGETKDRFSDVRIVAATNRNLRKEVNANAFREDLYYRLAVISLKLPPLRERRTDLPLLAKSLLNQINEQFALTEPGYEPKTLSRSAFSFMKRHAWRGNVRQLHNALVQAAVMCDGDVLKSGDLLTATADYEEDEAAAAANVSLCDGFSVDKHLDEIQRQLLIRAMDESDGVLAKASHLLGIENYQTFDARLKRLGVDKRRWKK